MPPTAVPSGGTTDGPLFGNGELAVIFGGQTGGFSFNFGSNSFVREIGASGGVAAMPGGVDVYAPVFSNATFSAAQVIANGTVTSAFTKSGVGTLRTSSFVRPMHRGVSLMVSKITYAADAGGPRSIELGVAARAGPLGHADDFLIWGPCSATPSILVANRSNGENWQDIYRGVRPAEASLGSRITRVAIAVSAFTASGGNAFTNVSVPGAGMDVGRSANGTVQLSTGETLMLLTAVVNNRDIKWADPVAAAMDALAAIQANGLSATVSEAEAANSAAWREYWAKSSVSLPHSLVTERYYWASLYLLKLAAGGNSPPGLYGPFIVSDEMMWSGDIHLNYNYQATCACLVTIFMSLIIVGGPGGQRSAHDFLFISGPLPHCLARVFCRLWSHPSGTRRTDVCVLQAFARLPEMGSCLGHEFVRMQRIRLPDRRCSLRQSK